MEDQAEKLHLQVLVLPEKDNSFWNYKSNDNDSEHNALTFSKEYFPNEINQGMWMKQVWLKKMTLSARKDLVIYLQGLRPVYYDMNIIFFLSGNHSFRSYTLGLFSLAYMLYLY